MAVFSAFVECPECKVEYLGSWPVAGDVQDLAEAPVADQGCGNCGYVVKAMPYEGWSFMTEAG